MSLPPDPTAQPRFQSQSDDSSDGFIEQGQPSANPAARSSRSGKHTAGSAAILLMLSAVVSGVLGLVRIKVINSLWGAGAEQDAYQAAFKLPDLLAYFLIGGA